ncbi:hypothetical protein KY284_024039 [Solanum tuberosum]|nr:hypothetical protein KY284_024039 [Solanum tuberosum]
MQESFGFTSCLEDCDLQDGGFLGAKFTLSDHRDPLNIIWKRLDRLAYNSHRFDKFRETSISHFLRTCFDHAPLLIKCVRENANFVKYLRFLNIWTEHKDYMSVVQDVWNRDQEGNPLQILHQKLKIVSKALSGWSRIAFGDFYEDLKRLEILIKDLEEASINNNSQENMMNLSKARAKFTRFLKIQDKVMFQKARVKWLEEGDTNSTFFHNVIKDKNKRLSIHKIKDQDGNWVEGTTQVATAAVNYFSNLFKAEDIDENNDIFIVIDRVVTREDSISLTSLPSIQELKDVVFSIDPDSAPGPNGLSGKFYQIAWPIIALDVHAAINSSFQGATLPKFFTHTCLVMLPKVVWDSP